MTDTRLDRALQLLAEGDVKHAEAISLAQAAEKELASICEELGGALDARLRRLLLARSDITRAITTLTPLKEQP